MAFTDLGSLTGRVLLSGIFLHEAWFKLADYALASRYMQAFGLPAELLPLAIAFEAVAGTLVLVGLFTRSAAIALAAFCVFTAVMFHNKLGDINQRLHFEKDLAIAGGFLVLAAFGPGRLSLDGWWRGRRVRDA